MADNLGTAIYRALTGGRTPRSEGRTTQAKAQALMKAHGSTKAVAAELGVSQRTVQRYLKGAQEARNTARGANADRLAVAERKARMTKAGTKRVAKASGGPKGTGLVIRAVVTVSSDTRERPLHIGASLPPDALEAVIEKFEQEGPDAAAQELQDIINIGYFHGGRGQIDEITEIEW